ncbi:hypothetical protein RND81_03G229200 [Saponaria officinalis]|uniref:Uncharacterized protein n=1 Tax=Saponaria officinalis TaxID=3572 RepID=A0AAW1M8M0_SAPOF
MATNQQEQIGTYFLLQSKLNASLPPSSPSSSIKIEPLPSELNTVNCSGKFIVVSPDKLTVQYTIVNLHNHDVGVVQANHPAPVNCLTYYFEMKVLNSGAHGYIAIGFTPVDFQMCRQPGWDANSYGYNGDDGLLYYDGPSGEPFGPTFTEGDTVGAGINYATQELFFTKNGVIVGTASKNVKCQLFPSIGLHSKNEEVTVNFRKEPFLFDIKAYEAQERLKQQTMIEKITLPQSVSHDIVRSYLLHYGYKDTLDVFDMANNNSVAPIAISQENGFVEPDSMYSLKHRMTLRQLIKSGKMDAVFGKLREWYPQIIQDDKSPVVFLLHCQKFIELVRVKELKDAVEYGRVELAKFFGRQEYEELVRECVALLAYEEPTKSPLGYLLGDSQREVVADAVNAMILSTNPNSTNSQSCFHSQLDKLVRQLTVCRLEKRFLNGDQGEPFYLPSLLRSGNTRATTE